LKHLSQKEDELVTESCSELIVINRWTHILSLTALELQSLWLYQEVAPIVTRAPATSKIPPTPAHLVGNENVRSASRQRMSC
jgi:hypothetical protein